MIEYWVAGSHTYSPHSILVLVTNLGVMVHIYSEVMSLPLAFISRHGLKPYFKGSRDMKLKMWFYCTKHSIVTESLQCALAFSQLKMNSDLVVWEGPRAIRQHWWRWTVLSLLLMAGWWWWWCHDTGCRIILQPLWHNAIHYSSALLYVNKRRCTIMTQLYSSNRYHCLSANQIPPFVITWLW